jgi:hypothetical protein
MRTIRTLPFLALAGALFLCVGPAASQPLPIDVEVAYRWLDIAGNRDMYRSQVNERSGFLVRSLSFAEHGSTRTKLADRFRLDVSDLGAGPAGAVRLEASRRDLYDLRISYRRTELFSSLPLFANPFFEQGVVPGQQTYDRERHLLNVDVELLPGRAIRPLLGYTWNRSSGPGRTTYTVGGDEFRLDQDLADTEQEIRFGTAFDVGPVSGVVTQGWRKLHETETLSLTPGAGSGNSSGTVLGTPVAAADLRRETTTDATTPVTSAVVTGRIGTRIRLLGSYVRAAVNGDTVADEGIAGMFVSFPLASLFTGTRETTSTRARNAYVSGGGRVEATLVEGVDVRVGYASSERDLDGSALVSTLLLGTVTFGGIAAGDVQRIIDAKTSLERREDVFDARVSARMLGPFALTAGFTQTDEHVSVTPDAAEIVVPGGQGGNFARQIRGLDLGVSLTTAGFTVAGDVRRQRADRPVVRTDFIQRDRYRLRVSWKATRWGRIGATAVQVDSNSEWPDIRMGGRFRQIGGELELTPVKPLRVRFSAGRFQTDRSALYRRPQDFGVDVSRQMEDGRFYEGGVTLALAGFTFDGSYASFDNHGTTPFRIDRARARAEAPVRAHLSVVASFEKDRYLESFAGALGNFDANRYALGVRFTP